MAQTPEWWLNRLARELDLRSAQLGTLRRYMDGNAPLPEGAEGCREAYRQFQRKSRTNFAELIVDAVVDRMIVSGFQIDNEAVDDDEARKIWKANRLGTWSADVHRDMIGLSAGYVCVQAGRRDDDVEITYERPEQVITDHDPSRPDRVRAGVKVYRDDVEGVDVAYSHALNEDNNGVVEQFFREIPINKEGIRQPILTVAGKWLPATREGFRIGPEETGLRTVPIVPFVNRGGKGEFETHTDLLDRINWDILQRLVIVAMQAYRQRATKGDLPEIDESGSPIDYGEIFKPGPGALWQLPEGVEMWESGQTDITGVLTSAKDDIRDLAAVTRTPMGMLLPDNANQSAEGASFAKEGLVFKTGDRIERAKPQWGTVMRLALAIKSGDSEESIPEIDASFLPPERVSMAEKYDAVSKAGDDVPWRYRMTEILGFDGDVVDRMEAERVNDALMAASFAPPQAEATPVADGRAA